MAPKNFTQTLYAAYQEVPDAPAIYLLCRDKPDLRISYHDLFLASSNVADALEKACINPREVVILILQHGQEIVTSFFGAILRGAIPSIMPFLTEKLSPEKYRDSLASLLKITKPAAIITYTDFIEEVKEACAGSSVRSILDSADIPGINHNTLQKYDPIQIENRGGFHLTPNEIVLLQHSSGTTGLQKGVALSYRAISNQLASYSKALNLNPNDVVVSWLPLYHDMGLIAGFILPVTQRIPLVLMSPFDWVRAPHRLFQAISDYKGTLCWLPNFAYNFCAKKIRDRDLEHIDLSSLRAVTNCSEPMYWESHQLFLQRFQPYGFSPEALTTSYAMAENVFAVTQGGIDQPLNVEMVDQALLQSKKIAKLANTDLTRSSSPQSEDQANIIKMLSAGPPIEGTEVCILDHQGEKLPDRHIGEIAILSNCLLSGYYHRPDLTQEAFLHGWFLTGDLGYLADGELYITGRKKDLIIVGGKNIYPQDLENIVGEVPGVHPGRVVAFGIYNENSGTEDVVVIAEIDLDEQKQNLLRKESEEEKKRISEEIRKQVNQSSDIALRYVSLVDKSWLIKTSSGKIARSANKEKYLAMQPTK